MTAFMKILIIIFMLIFRGSALQELLSKVNALSDVKRRAIASVIGAAVGDAAARPLHWLYDRKKLEEIVQDKDPAFWPTSESPFYSLPTGRRSCYNDVALAMLRSLPADKQVLFDSDTYLNTISDMYSPTSEYAVAIKKRQEAYDPAKKMEERKPIEGPWQHAAVTCLVGHLTKNEDISGNPSLAETDGFCSVIPLIARHAALSGDGLYTSLSKILPAAALLTSNEVSMKHAIAATAIVRHVIHFEEFDPELVDFIISSLENNSDLKEGVALVKADMDTNYSDANDAYGKGCGNPGSFKGSLLAMLTSKSYPECIRKIVKGGGCNCSRANFAGACFGALYGIGGERGIPEEWIRKTEGIEEIITLAIEKIA